MIESSVAGSMQSAFSANGTNWRLFLPCLSSFSSPFLVSRSGAFDGMTSIKSTFLHSHPYTEKGHITSANVGQLVDNNWKSGMSHSPHLAVLCSIRWLGIWDRAYTKEEHFVSNLHFSWPQVSCTTDCPTRGSRVVLASFRDCLGQIQKFALRFYTGNDAQRFMDAVKKSLMDIISIKFPGGDFGCQNTSRSEYIASNALQNRTDEESNFVNPDVGCSPEMPVLSLLCNQHVHPQQPSTADSLEAVPSALPPSFTDLLTGIDTEKEPPKVPEETDLRSQITRYLLDSSFHEMLVKVDKVIGELGGDLSL